MKNNLTFFGIGILVIGMFFLGRLEGASEYATTVYVSPSAGQYSVMLHARLGADVEITKPTSLTEATRLADAINKDVGNAWAGTN